MKYIDYRDYKIKKDGDAYKATRIDTSANKTMMAIFVASTLENLIGMIDAEYDIVEKRAVMENKVFSLVKFIYWAGSNGHGLKTVYKGIDLLKQYDGKQLPTLPKELDIGTAFTKDWMVDKDAWKAL